MAPPGILILLAPPILSGTYAAVTALGGGVGAVTATLEGVLGGYMAYDLIHYATHNAKSSALLEPWRKYHMLHHFSGEESRFGVSSAWLDILTGKYRSEPDMFSATKKGQ